MRTFGGIRAVAVVGAVLCALTGAATSGAGTPDPTTEAFNYTGAEQTFVVPAGVHSLHVVATGGQGAPGQQPAATGGAATVTADVAVTPGKTLYVEVGGNGQNGAQAAAYNGGGFAGSATAGGGGGASDIQTCSNIDPFACDIHEKALIVAAGSGGGGSNGDDGQGGAGGPQGVKGSDAQAVPRTTAATGGNPGSIGGGGTGGNLSTANDGACLYSASGNQQGGSSFGLEGGIGGAPEIDNDQTVHGGGGGGGGGGYYGGGGGGGGTQIICNDSSSTTYIRTGGAGGGSGASFVKGLTEQETGAHTSLDSTGVPKITITYTATDPNADLGVKASGPRTLKKGKKATFEFRVRNAGPDLDTSLRVKAKLPKGLKLIQATLSGSGQCPLHSSSCTAEELASGKSLLMKVKAKATKTGQQTLRTTVAGELPDANEANNIATLTTKVKNPKKHHR
jgi:hypothetical protein